MAFLLVAFLLLTTIVPSDPATTPLGPARSMVRATPVPLDPSDPSRRQAGGLVFLRGWLLESDEPRFGGISAMQVESDRVVAISDSGVLLEFGLPRNEGPVSLLVWPLSRRAAGGKLGHDTEAMLISGSAAWVAFERRNRIARFRRDDWREQAAAQPAPMRSWRTNSGPEGMIRLPDGRFLVFAEGRREESTSPVAMFLGDPADPSTRALALRYRRPAGFRLTDAALLPDGRILLLHRRFSWVEGVSAKLGVAETEGLRAGATIEGRDLAELRPPLNIGNMEALSVTQEGGRTIVRIASDNNFMRWQRTLLLEFALVESAS